MTRAEFDTWKDTYREAVDDVVAFSGQNLDYFTQLKATALVDLVRHRVGDPACLTALDVGCGVGFTDRHLVHRFGKVLGVDVSEAIIERAAIENPSADYRVYDGRTLPFADESVDVTFAICVVHHVPTSDWGSFASEMARVLRPGGSAVIFEHNPFNPLTRRVVKNCVFDQSAVLLRRRRAAALLGSAGLVASYHRYIAFLPFGGAWLAPVEAALRRVPLGAQYYVSAMKR